MQNELQGRRSMSAPEIDINALMDVAVETANDLLIGATECVTAMLELLPEDQAETLGKRPIPVAIHALLQHLDCRAEERQQQQAAMIEALRALRESIDSLAGNASETPTEREREIIYRALEMDYICKHEAVSIKDMDAALLRFKRLAGLGRSQIEEAQKGGA